MDILLKKDNEFLTLKSGPALYLYLILIPAVGFLIIGFISFTKKQFKMAFLNTILLHALLVLLLTVTSMFLEWLPLDPIFVIWFMITVYVVLVAGWLYLIVELLNYLTIKQYIANGFIIVNEPSLQLGEALSNIDKAKRPKWIFIY